MGTATPRHTGMKIHSTAGNKTPYGQTTFVTAGAGIAEIRAHIDRPLIGFSQKYPSREFVAPLANVLEKSMSLGQFIAIGAPRARRSRALPPAETRRWTCQVKSEKVDPRFLHAPNYRSSEPAGERRNKCQ